MKNFVTLQINVLRSIAKRYGIDTPEEERKHINDFLKTETGIKAMKHFREVLNQKFGIDVKNGNPHTDTETHPGFDPNNRDAHVELVNILADEIMSRMGK